MSTIHWPLDAWIDNVAAAALTSKPTVLATFDLAKNCIERGIDGDFVECGVFGGVQCALMARAIMLAGAKKRVHLFDSFAGVPAAGPNDEGWTHPVGVSACSMEGVEQNMAQWGIDPKLLAYHPGWFDERIPAFARGKTPIAILRLDADLYGSTKICIEHLYQLVSPGGWVIVDDFALPGCRKAVDDFMKGIGYPPVYFQKT